MTFNNSFSCGAIAVGSFVGVGAPEGATAFSLACSSAIAFLASSLFLSLSAFSSK